MVAHDIVSGARLLEAGQTLVETALVVPILVLFLSAVVDVGRFMFLQSNVGSAADSLARQVESEPQMSATQASRYLQATFPNLADGAQVAVGSAEYESEQVDYRVFDARSATFKTRPSTASRSKVAVRVTYEDGWLTPGLISVSELVNGTGGFRIERVAWATLDTTLETW